VKILKSGPLYILLAAIFWSFGGVLNKLIPWSGLSIAAIRSLIAAITIGLYRKSFRFKITPSTVAASICIVITTVLFMMANKLTSAANAIVLQYTSPLFIIILSLVVLKQKPKKRDIFALIGVGLGIGLFFFEQFKGGSILGDLLALASGLTFAGVFFSNKLPGASPIDATFMGNALGVLLIPFLFVDQQFTSHFTFWPIVTILVMGIFQQGCGYIFFSKGIKTTSATSSSIIATLEPILNPLWVFLVIGEMPSPMALVGGAIVLGTVMVYNTIVTNENFKTIKTVSVSK
jgi:drug/metabolite transporter (DMT)-like permease